MADVEVVLFRGRITTGVEAESAYTDEVRAETSITLRIEFESGVATHVFFESEYLLEEV